MKTKRNLPLIAPLRASCAWILITTLTSGCCTDRLWQSRSPDANITEVHYKDMTESALIEDGFVYTKDDEKQLYFVETSTSKNQMDLTARIAATPVTLAADGAIWATFGYISLLGMMGGAPRAILPPLHEDDHDSLLF